MKAPPAHLQAQNLTAPLGPPPPRKTENEETSYQGSRGSDDPWRPEPETTAPAPKLPPVEHLDSAIRKAPKQQQRFRSGKTPEVVDDDHRRWLQRAEEYANSVVPLYSRIDQILEPHPGRWDTEGNLLQELSLVYESVLKNSEERITILEPDATARMMAGDVQSWKAAFDQAQLKDLNASYVYSAVPCQAGYVGWNLEEFERKAREGGLTQEQVFKQAIEIAHLRWKKLLEHLPEFFAAYSNVGPRAEYGTPLHIDHDSAYLFVSRMKCIDGIRSILYVYTKERGCLLYTSDAADE